VGFAGIEGKKAFILAYWLAVENLEAMVSIPLYFGF